MANSRICSIAGCGKTQRNNGMCSSHDYRNLKYGDPFAGSTPKGAARALLDRAVIYDGDDCILWPYGHNGLGYGTIKINKKTEYPHQIVCEAFNGEKPSPSHEAAHSCGRGREGCITGAHLSWKTRLDNQSDRKDHGTYIFGERIGTSKLTEDDVRLIRARAPCEGQYPVAAEFGITQSMVSNIMRRKAWAWLD